MPHLRREWQRLQVCCAREPSGVTCQELTSPDVTVQPKTSAVHDDANYRTLVAGIGQAGCQMGVMVLHSQSLVLVLHPSITASHIIGMHIMRNYRWLNIEKSLSQTQVFFPGLPGFQVLQVAVVLAQKRLVLAYQAERVFQFRAAGKYCRSLGVDFYREGCVTPRAPDWLWSTIHDKKDAVI